MTLHSTVPNVIIICYSWTVFATLTDVEELLLLVKLLDSVLICSSHWGPSADRAWAIMTESGNIHSPAQQNNVNEGYGK